MKNAKLKALSFLMVLLMSVSFLFTGCKSTDQENYISPEEAKDAEELIKSAAEKTENATSYAAKHTCSELFGNETHKDERTYCFENNGILKFSIDTKSNKEYSVGNKVFSYTSETEPPYEDERDSAWVAEDIFFDILNFQYDLDKIDETKCSMSEENGNKIIKIHLSDPVEYYKFTDPDDPDNDSPEFKEQVKKYSKFSGYVCFTVNNDGFLTEHKSNASFEHDGKQVLLEEVITFSQINSTKVDAPEWLSEYYTFDENGLMIKRMNYDYEGNFTGRTEFEYDSDGNCTKYTYYDENGKLSFAQESEYDSNGTVIKETYYDENGKLNYIYEYDTNGNATKYTEYAENGKIYYTMEFDTNGNVIKYTYYDENGELSSTVEFENNSDGNCIKSTTYDKNGQLIRTVEFEYDSDGNCTKYTYYDENGKLYSIEEYNSDGKLIKSTDYDKNGQLIRTVEYEYDSDGNRIKKTYYDENGNLDYIIS